MHCKWWGKKSTAPEMHPNGHLQLTWRYSSLCQTNSEESHLSLRSHRGDILYWKHLNCWSLFYRIFLFFFFCFMARMNGRNNYSKSKAGFNTRICIDAEKMWTPSLTMLLMMQPWCNSSLYTLHLVSGDLLAFIPGALKLFQHMSSWVSTGVPAQ